MLELCLDNLPALCSDICEYISGFKAYCRTPYKTYVYNVPIAFDTETTSYTKENKEKVAWCYIWMLRFGSALDPNSIAIYSRDLQLLPMLLKSISDNLQLGYNKETKKKRMILIYAHNLSFDIEFIRDRLNIIKSLCESSHTPISIELDNGIEFRDSLILTGKSLETMGKELNNGILKQVGSLDYSKIRTPKTPLTDKEMVYCQGDIDVLSCWIQKEIDTYAGRLVNVPLTSTGRVRKYAREHIFHTKSFGSYSRYRALMDDCVLTPEEYKECKNAYYGGFTHANIRNVNKIMKDVKSYDFTSSYPAVMLTERFPMGKPEHVDNMSFEELKKYVNNPKKSLIFELELSDVYLKDEVPDSYLYLDADKGIRVENGIIDNGRIRSCDKIHITVSNIDFMIINRCYDYDHDNISISNVLIWNNKYLPSKLLEVVIDLYKAKTELKGVKGREEEYALKKGMLNSLYGMCVTKILRDIVNVDSEGWITSKLSDEEGIKNIEKNNNSKTRFLFYPWGVFISAYARYNLWTAIVSLGEDYIYSDTDSIKVKANSTKLDEYLKMYQSDLDKKIEWMLNKRRMFDISDLKPKTKEGKEKPIGVWDFEGEYKYFKTLGAKRYIRFSKDNGLETTVSGIKPMSLPKYLMKDYIDNGLIIKDEEGKYDIPEIVINDIFDLFDNGLEVDEEHTNKLASVYCSNVDLEITDYMGIKCHVKQKFGVHLCPTHFTLVMDNKFLGLINRLKSYVK